jgi:RNA polymerase sigma-70 factor (ECF subfamily)
MKDTAASTEHVWNALGAELRAFLRSRVPSDADADDLLQDVFVRVYEKLGTLRQAERVESWVYQIARNAVTDFYRRRATREVDGIEQFTEPHDETDGEFNHNRAVGSWLSLMIDMLPPKLREALQMYEVDGISQTEIAERLGISLSGAKSRVQRGRQQLEHVLLGSCQLELDRRGNVINCQPVKTDSCAEISCECDDVRS